MTSSLPLVSDISSVSADLLTSRSLHCVRNQLLRRCAVGRLDGVNRPTLAECMKLLDDVADIYEVLVDPQVVPAPASPATAELEAACHRRGREGRSLGRRTGSHGLRGRRDELQRGAGASAGDRSAGVGRVHCSVGVSVGACAGRGSQSSVVVARALHGTCQMVCRPASIVDAGSCGIWRKHGVQGRFLGSR